MRVRLDPPHKVEGGSAQEPKSHPPSPNHKPWPGLGSHLPPNPLSKGGHLPPNPPSKGGAHGLTGTIRFFLFRGSAFVKQKRL